MSASQFVLRHLYPVKYRRLMKTLHNSLQFDSCDVAKFRLHVLQHMREYGWKSAVSAFGVKKSTLYDWKKAFEQSGNSPLSLVPKTTRPHHVRHMQIDPEILEFIKAIRQQYGRVGKKKMKLLSDAFAKEQGLNSVGTTAIEKIVRRNHWNFAGTRKWKIKRAFKKTHTKHAPKETTPGYIEMDSVRVTLMSQTHFFITAIDIVTKFAWCQKVTGLTAKNAQLTLQLFQEQTLYPVRSLQTDNGSEFLAEFHAYLESFSINHIFIYPRSPRINGVIERFNRTIQEEFLNHCDELIYDPLAFHGKLTAYLNWYNTKRPHASLGYISPVHYQP